MKLPSGPKRIKRTEKTKIFLAGIRTRYPNRLPAHYVPMGPKVRKHFQTGDGFTKEKPEGFGSST